MVFLFLHNFHINQKINLVFQKIDYLKSFIKINELEIYAFCLVIILRKSFKLLLRVDIEINRKNILINYFNL